MDTETNDLGRAPAGQATHEPSPAVSALTGECPSRGKPWVDVVYDPNPFLSIALPRRNDMVSLVSGTFAQYVQSACLRGMREAGFWPDGIVDRLRFGKVIANHVLDSLERLAALGIEAGTDETQGGSTA